MQRKQQGFTLIELVIVIVILGVLSAFALPRFADLGGDARAATIQGATGSIRAASAIARSACLASADCDESAPKNGEDATVTMEGESIPLAFGFPTADAIIDAAQLRDDFFFTVADGTATIRTESRDGEDGCQVTYAEAEEEDGEVVRPLITVTVKDC